MIGLAAVSVIDVAWLTFVACVGLVFFCQAEDGIRGLVRSRGLGDVYKRQVIVAAVRTPIGSYLGSLSSVKGPQLGAIAIKELISRTGVKPEDVSEVILGCVLPAGMGQAPARQAAIYEGLPYSCLLYTSDAADDLHCVDPGGPRIIKT